MKRMVNLNFRLRRRGAVVVLTAISIVTLLICASLAVDVGYICALTAEQQNTADAGSLAGAIALQQEDSEGARERALKIIARNQKSQGFLSLKDQIVEIGIWDSVSQTFTALDQTEWGNGFAVRVRAARNEAPLFFARLIGHHTTDVWRDAVAVGSRSCGGIWGLKVGYCTMVGGERGDFEHIEPLLKTLAPKDGYLYCGPTGAGHFVKMVHNGIEYALMEAYGEGFEILKASPYGEHLNFSQVAHLWNQGSVVRSWLLELLEDAFKKDPELASIEGYVEDSGEGRWTVQQAVDSGVSATAIAHALFKRFQSRQPDLFSDKVLAALRNEFGGHAVKKT